MPNYRIMFPQGCGAHKQGDVVNGNFLGDVAYLLRVGAVEETEDPESSTVNSVELDAKVKEAVDAAVAAKDAEIAALNQTLTDLQKQQPKGIQKQLLADKDAQIKSLQDQVEALTKQVADLQANQKEEELEEVPEEETTPTTPAQ